MAEDRYKLIDSELPTRLATKIFSDMARTQISEGEIEVIRDSRGLFEEALSGDRPSLSQRAIGAAEQARQLARGAYDFEKIGCWPFGCLRALDGLALAVVHDGKCKPVEFWLSRVVAQLTTAEWMAAKMPIRSVVESLLKYMIHFGMSDSILSFLESEAREELEATERAQDSPDIESWLRSFGDVFPFIHAQWVTFLSVRALMSTHQISASALPTRLDEAQCRSEAMKFEERTAYTVELFASYHFYPDRASKYKQEILDLVAKEGRRATERRVRFDYVRLLIPKFLREEAIDAVTRI